MSVNYKPKVVTDNLILYLDAANSKSLVNSSANFVDIATNRTSTMTGSYGYNTSLYSTPVLELNNNATSSGGQVQVVTDDLNTIAVNHNFTVMFAAKKNFFGLAGSNNGNSQLFQGVVNGYNSGWRIIETSQGTPGGVFTGRQAWSFGYTDITTNIQVQDTVGSTNRMCIVAFTVSPTTISGFVNGNTSSINNPRSYVSGTSQPRISWIGAGAGSWNGLIGFWMIYNRALTSEEVLQNYDSLRNRYGL